MAHRPENEDGNFAIFCAGMMLWYFMSGVEYGITLANLNDLLLRAGAAQGLFKLL